MGNRAVTTRKREGSTASVRRPTLAMFDAAIGAGATSRPVQTLLKKLGYDKPIKIARRRNDYDPPGYTDVWPKARGLRLIFVLPEDSTTSRDPADLVLHEVVVFPTWDGVLPKGLAFGDTFNVAQRKLGAPSYSRWGLTTWYGKNANLTLEFERGKPKQGKVLGAVRYG